MDQRNIHIKNYITNLFAPEDIALQEARIYAKENGLPDIHISAHVGKILSILLKIQGGTRALEIGTLGGYSTLWMAKALGKNGYILTLELFSEHIEIAKKNIAEANLDTHVEFRQGRASDLMQILLEEGTEPFDLIFIDADKKNYPLYLDLALKLSKKGTLLVGDNLIPKDQKINAPNPEDKDALGIYAFNEKMAKDPRLDSILLPTIARQEGRLDALGISIVT